MYSASVVDRATVAYKVAFQLIAQPPREKTYPIIDLLLSKSPAKSKSTNPTIPSLVLPKCNQTLVMPLKYLKIHWTALQYSLPGFAIYLLTTLTTCAKCRRIHII